MKIQKKRKEIVKIGFKSIENIHLIFMLPLYVIASWGLFVYTPLKDEKSKSKFCRKIGSVLLRNAGLG